MAKNMKYLFSIGEVAKIKEITIKALRYYHKMGILSPKYIDDATGYRYYSIEQFVYIDIIKGCRALGTSIKELQEIFKECDTDKLLKFLELKRQEAEENINKLNEIIENIDVLNEGIKASKKLLKDKEITIKFFECRYIIVLPCQEVGSLKELLYYCDLEKVIQDKNLKVAIQKGIIYEMNPNGKLEAKYVFSEIEESKEVKLDDKDIKVLPKGNYLTIVHNKEDEQECARRISDYIKENNIQVDSVMEFDLLNDLFDTETYSSQIQIYLGENK